MQNKDKKFNKYRSKYKYIKKIVKSLIIENAALCDEVAKIQESITIVKDERKYLLRRLLEYENDNEVPQSTKGGQSMNSSQTFNGTSGKAKKWKSPDSSFRNVP